MLIIFSSGKSRCYSSGFAVQCSKGYGGEKASGVGENYPLEIRSVEFEMRNEQRGKIGKKLEFSRKDWKKIKWMDRAGEKNS
jgi:hypothetical protein